MAPVSVEATFYHIEDDGFTSTPVARRFAEGPDEEDVKIDIPGLKKGSATVRTEIRKDIHGKPVTFLVYDFRGEQQPMSGEVFCIGDPADLEVSRSLMEPSSQKWYASVIARWVDTI